MSTCVTHLFSPADILIINGTGLFSWAIKWAEHSPASHTGLIVGTYPTLVLEALGRVETRPFHESIRGVREFWIASPRNVSDEQRMRIVETATSWSGASYGYWTIFMHLLDRWYHTDWWTTNLAGRRRPICSYLVAAAYASVGLDFGVGYRSARPDEILKFVLAHPRKYRVLHHRGRAR